MRRKILLMVLLALALAAPAYAKPVKLDEGHKVFEPLAEWLNAQGVPSEQVVGLFNSPQVKFESKLLSSMLSRREVTRDYQGFFAANNLKRAAAFKTKYSATLKRVENATQVPAGVVVAILLIESDLGGNTGKIFAFNALASQAVLDGAPAREMLARAWPADQREYLQSQAAYERFSKRANWARNELLALIRLSRLWGVSPLAVRGSAAGALGWCQFMPTSIEQWGDDGSGDGRVDVNNPHDVIASIGRYLQEHGWRPGLSREEQLQVVLTYNKSLPYAEAVLTIAEKL